MCLSPKRIRKSKHSRRIVPISRSHSAFAFGALAGIFSDDQPNIPDLFIEFRCVDGVSVMNEKPAFMLSGKCFPELLCRPAAVG
jgi:hypothetical protein